MNKCWQEMWMFYHKPFVNHFKEQWDNPSIHRQSVPFSVSGFTPHTQTHTHSLSLSLAHSLSRSLHGQISSLTLALTETEAGQSFWQVQWPCWICTEIRPCSLTPLSAFTKGCLTLFWDQWPWICCNQFLINNVFSLPWDLWYMRLNLKHLTRAQHPEICV